MPEPVAVAAIQWKWTFPEAPANHREGGNRPWFEICEKLVPGPVTFGAIQIDLASGAWRHGNRRSHGRAPHRQRTTPRQAPRPGIRYTCIFPNLTGSSLTHV